MNFASLFVVSPRAQETLLLGNGPVNLQRRQSTLTRNSRRRKFYSQQPISNGFSAHRSTAVTNLGAAKVIPRALRIDVTSYHVSLHHPVINIILPNAQKPQIWYAMT